ncbi:MAG: HAD hydrolase-like protein, partial [Candidatus Parvarchaeota archaeon]|nr:HAD hydrolase-like protein [Candidatus Parvarchaeota archaeon]
VSTIPERKISPIAFSKTVKMLNVSPKNVLMVGDRLDIDVEHGKEVGMRTVLFKSYASSGTGLYKPDYIVSDLREILSIIK